MTVMVPCGGLAEARPPSGQSLSRFLTVGTPGEVPVVVPAVENAVDVRPLNERVVGPDLRDRGGVVSDVLVGRRERGQALLRVGDRRSPVNRVVDLRVVEDRPVAVVDR